MRTISAWPINAGHDVVEAIISTCCGPKKLQVGRSTLPVNVLRGHDAGSRKRAERGPATSRMIAHEGMLSAVSAGARLAARTTGTAGPPATRWRRSHGRWEVDAWIDGEAHGSNYDVLPW